MEEIPLPTSRIRDGRPINIESNIDAFGGQRFGIRLDWNSVAQQWAVEFEHIPRDFTITSSSALQAYRFYDYEDFLSFLVADPSGEETEVNRRTLGDPMRLWVLPGPAGQQPE